MLFYATLRRELAQSFTATLIVLVTIVMTMMLIRTLGLASKGAVNPRDIFLIMTYMTVSFAPTILSLALLLSICNTLARLYKDSEMAVWFASGQGLAQFVRPVLRFAWPILLVTALLSLFAWPWANQAIAELRNEFEQRSDIDRITPGEFQQNASGTRVFFTDSKSNVTQGGNIFIYTRKGERSMVTTAGDGRISRETGTAMLILQNGQNVVHDAATGAKNVSRFGSYGTAVKDQSVAQLEVQNPKNVATPLLWSTADGRGELSWRLGMALAGVNFALLALLLARSNVRAGKGNNMLLAVLAFALYYNLMNLAKSWVASGKVGFSVCLLGLHGGVLLLCLLWLWARQRNWSWRNLLPRAAGPVTRGAV